MGKQVKEKDLRDAVKDVLPDAIDEMTEKGEAPAAHRGTRALTDEIMRAIKASDVDRDAEGGALESTDRAAWRQRNGESVIDQLAGHTTNKKGYVSPVTKQASGQRHMRRDQTHSRPPIGSGQLAAKYLWYSAKACQQGKNIKRPSEVAEIAKGHDDDHMVEVIEKDQQSSDFSQGGALLPTEVSEDIIAFLHGRTTFRQLEPEIIPLESGSLRFPRVDASVNASWVGEAGTVNSQSLDTGSVNLDEHYLQIVVIVTNQMIRHGEPQVGVLSILEQEMQRSAATTEETALLRGTGANSEPEGLRNIVASGNQDLSRTQSGSTSTVTEIVQDLMKLQDAVYASGSNVMKERPAYILSHRTSLGLQALTDADDNPSPFAEMIAGGELFGAQIGETNQLPTDLDIDTSGDTDHTEAYFCEMSEALLGQGIEAQIDESSEATVFDGNGNPYRLFLQNARALRLKHGMDLALRHDTAAANLKNIDWGADIFD